MGVPREMGGLQESVVAFRKHHKEVGDALLNVTEGKDKDEDRPAYVRQPFPKMIYHPEKGELIVENDADLKLALKGGYRLEPYPKPQVALEDPKVEKLALEAKLKQKDGEIASLADLVQRLSSRLDALEKQ